MKRKLPPLLILLFCFLLVTCNKDDDTARPACETNNSCTLILVNTDNQLAMNVTLTYSNGASATFNNISDSETVAAIPAGETSISARWPYSGGFHFFFGTITISQCEEKTVNLTH